MNAKTYLSKLYRLDAIINSMIEEVSDLREKSTAIGSFDTSEKVGHSISGRAAYTEIVEKIADMEAEINKKVDYFVDLKKEITDVIDSISDPDQKLLLRYRYLNNYKWETIADLMSYSYRWIYILHGRALQSVEKRINNS